MAFCEAGQHASLHAFEYDGRRWCKEHLPPSGPVDPPIPALCVVGHRVHQAARTYWLPVMGRRVCDTHLANLVKEVIRRGDFGRR